MAKTGTRAIGLLSNRGPKVRSRPSSRVDAIALAGGLGIGLAALALPIAGAWASALEGRTPIWRPGRTALRAQWLQIAEVSRGRESVAGSRTSKPATGSGTKRLEAFASALCPGLGQVLQGRFLVGLAFFGAEIALWTAREAFAQGASRALGNMDRLASSYWDYDRLVENMSDFPDSCGAGEMTLEVQERIRVLEAADHTAWLEALAETSYRCGWDTDLSRREYLEVWNDREGSKSAISRATKILILNHVFAALEAFFGGNGAGRKSHVAVAADPSGRLRVALQWRL